MMQNCEINRRADGTDAAKRNKARTIALWIAFSLLAMLPQRAISTEAASEPPHIVRTKVNADLLNANRIGIVTGSVGGNYLKLGEDIATVVEDRQANPPLRVVVIDSPGSVANLDDLLNLTYVDIAFVQSDALAYLSQELAAADKLDPKHPKSGTIRFIARVGEEEVHLLAREPEPGSKTLTSIRDLSGKNISIGEKGSGTNITARALISQFVADARPPLEYSNRDAILKLKNGDIDAMFYVVKKPADFFKFDIGAEDIKKYGLHFLTIPEIPDPNNKSTPYYPTALTPADYPGLLLDNKNVATLYVPTVMAAFDFQKRGLKVRAASLQNFVTRFFSKFGELLQAGRSPSWHNVNLDCEVGGWTRLNAAETWIKNNPHPSASTPCDDSKR